MIDDIVVKESYVKTKRKAKDRRQWMWKASSIRDTNLLHSRSLKKRREEQMACFLSHCYNKMNVCMRINK